MESNCSTTMKSQDSECDKGVEAMKSSCSTPKGKRFKIGGMVSCPPAPKKRRITTMCLNKRPHIEFFAPPELEVFFLYAFRNNV
ncbi:hypothetical protein CDL12_10662 [Handroanthus impetiginosus]|uniref:Uncharacterized protein n=1 Tax=Handroanthus impetiginosus TaxID=429701 RepID=A0A2G9HGM0_9LAMI|nr:hypothetical protein CDL12_10662 [Handroanthus impetiginosus]